MIEKCQKREVFDWPWRERSLSDYGWTNWDRINTVCVQCKVNLYWDVTPYEDSAKHLCSYCSNCQQRVGKERDEHFSWNEDALPVYKCNKVEEFREERPELSKSCLRCDGVIRLEKGELKNWLSDLKKSSFGFVNSTPNSKARVVITTKRHINDIREMTSQEWNDLLPIIKDSIAKIDRVYKPAGYRLHIPIGALATQNKTHCYIRLVPKYKLNYGAVGTSEKYEPLAPEEAKKIEERLSANKEKIYAERSRVAAKLHNDTSPGYTVIAAKNFVSAESINNVDSEVWSQAGELLRECMQKIEDSLDFHDFTVSFNIGKSKEFSEIEKKGWKTAESIEEREKGSKKNEMTFALFPQFKEIGWLKWGGRGGRPRKNNKPVGSMENERIAEKLRDPEGYARNWGVKNTPSLRGNKAERERERESKTDWKPWIWGGTVATGTFVLGIVIASVWYRMCTKRRKKTK